MKAHGARRRRRLAAAVGSPVNFRPFPDPLPGYS